MGALTLALSQGEKGRIAVPESVDLRCEGQRASVLAQFENKRRERKLRRLMSQPSLVLGPEDLNERGDLTVEARKKLLARRFPAKRSKPKVRGKVVKLVDKLSAFVGCLVKVTGKHVANCCKGS